MKLYSNEIIQLLEGLDPQMALLQNGESQFTVKMLLDRSHKLAINLHTNGMQVGDRVIIASEVGVDFVVIMFATQLLKCQVSIIDPEIGRDTYKSKMEQFDPQWVFLDSRLAFLQEHPLIRQFYFKYKKDGLYFPRKKSIKTITTGRWMPLFLPNLSLGKILTQSVKDEVIMESVTDLPYLITYTSGTVAAPKGVLHSTRGLRISIELIANIIKSNQKQIMATHLPHYMLIGACAGVGTKLWDITWPAAKRVEFIKDEGITTVFAPPVEYQALIDYCRENQTMLPDSLTHLIIGSAPVHQAFLARLIQYLPAHTKITCFYGMTENLVVATIDGRTKVAMQSNGDPLGKPVEGVDLKIADDGEILIKSDQLYNRYWHLGSRNEWHATGDLGYLDEAGNIILKSRKKDMIIRKNFNLYPGLYTSTIQKIDGVIDAVFIGKYNEERADEEVHLFVEAQPKLTKEMLWEKLKSGSQSIDKDAWPDEIHFTQIPRKGRQFKIDRNKLRESIG